MENITVILTGDEVQYLANAIDTYMKTRGLAVATVGVMIVSKLQTASNGLAKPSGDSPEPLDEKQGTNKPGAS